MNGAFLRPVIFKNQKSIYMAINRKFNSKLFARDIIAKRENDVLTIRAAAEKAGVSVSTMFKAESGEGERIEVRNFQAICNFIETSAQKYFEK